MLDITNGVNTTNKITEGIEFGDLISINEGMWLIDRSAPTPSEKTITDSVPFMQGEYDFSMIMGERVFDNRPISYTFHIYERENSFRKFNQTIMENRLMSQGVIQLKDSYSPGYYYVGKCVSVDTKDDHVYGRLVVSIEFDCYPFKIKEAVEGSPYWDDYDVSDYYQETSFKLRRSTFKPMSVGQTATVGAWSTHYDGGSGISRSILGKSYTITEIRNTSQGVGDKAYYLSGLNKWVIEQDVVEAQNGAQTIDIYNSGTASVMPKITLTGPVTFIRGSEVFNLFTGVTESDFFRLMPGHNRFLVASGTASDVTIELHKEVI